MTPEENMSGQKRFVGDAKCLPVLAVMTPGLRPTMSKVRFGAIRSERES